MGRCPRAGGAKLSGRVQYPQSSKTDGSGECAWADDPWTGGQVPLRIDQAFDAYGSVIDEPFTDQAAQFEAVELAIWMVFLTGSTDHLYEHGLYRCRATAWAAVACSRQTSAA